MRKIWDIPGGIHPPENKRQSNATPIASVPLPEELILPLTQHIGTPALSLVAVGDHVLKGQKIAEAGGALSAALHAPSSGVVKAIEDRPSNHPSGLDAASIVIQCDGDDKWTQLTGCDNYLSLDPSELLNKIHQAGIAGLGGAGFPTAVKLQARQKIHTLIINGTECEPYITADDTLMRQHAPDIIRGSQLLAYILGATQIVIGIEDNKPEAIDTIRQAAQSAHSAIDVVDFPTKYPSGGEKQLIQILTGKEVASGNLPADMGIVVQNVGTAFAAYRAARFGEPLIQRVTTVVGESLSRQGNVQALIGTPIKHLLQAHGYQPSNNSRIIMGGPMMGFTLKCIEAPLIKTSNCVLAPSHSEMPPPSPASPCIRCGLCAEACPASLLPQQLFWYAQAENYPALTQHNLFDCIECGACSYVCPSNLPLVQYYRAAKGDIKRQQQEKEKSDLSRQRFEFRKQRLAKAEAEKEAKRLARKKAAEQAKLKLANTGDPSAENNAASNSAEATLKTHSSNEKDSRMRNLASAQQRLQNAQNKLRTAESHDETETRLSALAAAVKQAEQKLREAQAKVDASEQASDNEQQNAQQTPQQSPQQSQQQSQQRTVDSLKKRLKAAEQKLAEARTNNEASINALQLGTEKLSAKLKDAESELNHIVASAKLNEEQTLEAAPQKNAAELAIEKAQAKTGNLSAMSRGEKALAQIAALESRLQKARIKLDKAQHEQSDHVDALRNGVEKLEQKLKQAREQGS
ncbi:MAG: electron transport complex subunit RsxC [Cellvibrionaceae bacterium]|nr:electron transport complex subunit RsxC [Cellvibrionaceae bacterium]